MSVLSIDAISVVRPEQPLNLVEQHEEVGCSKFNAHILKKMMGIESVNYLNPESTSARALMQKSAELPIFDNSNGDAINFWCANTGARRSCYGSSLNRLLSRSDRGSENSRSAHAYMGMSNANRCVSLFKTISNLSRFSGDKQTHIIDTAELAFSDEMRVTRGLSVQGDAASYMLLRKTSKPKIRVCSSLMRYDSQFNKGIWCESKEVQAYENNYRDNIKKVVDEVLAHSNISLSDVDMVLPHNINGKSWKYLCEYLDISEERFYGKNIKTNGHCFCNDLIINLSDVLVEANCLNYIMAVAAGAGGMFGACVLEVVDGAEFYNERNYI